MKPFRIARSLLLAAACVFATPSSAAWPERPVKLVVPFAPGAMGDVLARMLADELRQQFNQSVVVENKAGAGGNIGAAAVAHAEPNGYTFLVAATNNLVINQFLYKDLGFDPLQQLVPVTFLVDVPSVVFINAQVPAKSMSEFVSYARSRKGAVNYGSPGTGTTPHLSAETINQKKLLGMTHVPYKGAGQAVQALLANEVQFYLGGAGLGAQHLQTGRLRAVAVSSSTRLAQFPDIPTFAEAGLGGINAGNWWGLAAPRGTPEAAIEKMATAVKAALASPKISARLNELGVMPIADGPQVMAARLREEAAFWQGAVREFGVKVQ